MIRPEHLVRQTFLGSQATSCLADRTGGWRAVDRRTGHVIAFRRAGCWNQTPGEHEAGFALDEGSRVASRTAEAARGNVDSQCTVDITRTLRRSAPALAISLAALRALELAAEVAVTGRSPGRATRARIAARAARAGVCRHCAGARRPRGPFDATAASGWKRERHETYRHHVKASLHWHWLSKWRARRLKRQNSRIESNVPKSLAQARASSPASVDQADGGDRSDQAPHTLATGLTFPNQRHFEDQDASRWYEHL